MRVRENDRRKAHDMNLEALNSLVARATAPSRFYRRLYGMKDGDAPLSINSLKEWRTLPFLTKKDLLNTPLSERSFVPIRDIDYLTSTSGTTGALPLFIPRAHTREYEFRTRFYDFAGAVLSSKPVPHQHEEFLATLGLPPRVVVLDMHNLEASARLARAAGVDAIFAYSPYLPLIAGHLVREGIAKDIRFIETGGDTCSRTQFEYMRTTFPNAILTSTYGLSDFENSPMGIQCRPSTDDEPAEMYHEKDGMYAELLDIETGELLEPKASIEGELVMSAYRGEPAAFPMIRYKTGDRVRVYEECCKEHRTWSFVVLGRLEIDFVRIPGGMLKADEIERVLRTLKDVVTDRFVLRVRDGSGGLPVRATLQVEPRASVDLAALTLRIARELRVSPSSSYQDGVASGLYESLKCEALDSTETSPNKQKRIILDR